MEELLGTIGRELPGASIAFDCLSPRGIRYLNAGMRRSTLPQEEVHWGLEEKSKFKTGLDPPIAFESVHCLKDSTRTHLDGEPDWISLELKWLKLAHFVEITPD